MYKIQRDKNQISALEIKTFSELGFTERKHLQEWLAKLPEALGEELLIIQKEFDGFDDTRERLDLLAIDKDANLVIIENKLDDTGRDVIWQALKYASYCSNLTKNQIADIFYNYLKKNNLEGDAQELLCEFLEVPDLGEVIINNGTNQRIIFVAANFRKEVTSTALWLLSHNIQIQCFKVTPYSSSDELFLNIEQIIPTPEAKELMIGMAQKVAEEKSASTELKSRHITRLAFWEQALEAFKTSKCDLFNNINPSKDHWSSAGSGLRAMPFTLIFGTKEVRVEFSMARNNAENNSFVFQKLLENKNDIENKFGNSLDWLPLEGKKACRIQYKKDIEGYNHENWPEIIDWMIDKMTALESTLRPYLDKINKELKG